MCVLTSEHEGTPNVLLEAMAAGLPVVATSVGGIPDIVQHGQTGFLVSGDDREALVQAVLKLIHDPDLRSNMGRRARAYVEETHSIRRLAENLSGLYEIAFARNRTKRNLAAINRKTDSTIERGQACPRCIVPAE